MAGPIASGASFSALFDRQVLWTLKGATHGLSLFVTYRQCDRLRGEVG